VRDVPEDSRDNCLTHSYLDNIFYRDTTGRLAACLQTRTRCSELCRHNMSPDRVKALYAAVTFVGSANATAQMPVAGCPRNSAHLAVFYFGSIMRTVPCSRARSTDQPGGNDSAYPMTPAGLALYDYLQPTSCRRRLRYRVAVGSESRF